MCEVYNGVKRAILYEIDARPCELFAGSVKSYVKFSWHSGYMITKSGAFSK